MNKRNVHGKYVIYEDDAKEGLKHLLYDLQKDETEPLFYTARKKGEAKFEDDMDRDWTLEYNRGDFTYTLIRRKSEY